MNELALTLSIFIGFAFQAMFSLFSGGLVSAGYIALYLTSPLRLLITFALAVIILFLIKALGHFTILFGRRRFAITMVISILLSYLIEIVLVKFSLPVDLRIIGYIVPGLIANDMEKQGVVKTLISILLISTLIYLIIHLMA